jgi:hypothetical protein
LKPPAAGAGAAKQEANGFNNMRANVHGPSSLPQAQELHVVVAMTDKEHNNIIVVRNTFGPGFKPKSTDTRLVV